MTAKTNATDPQPEFRGMKNFRVDLSGILAILSDSIYVAGAEVFVRELLQNATDAITARRLIDPDHEGMIWMRMEEAGDGGHLLTLDDNGIGLTTGEADRFLATIAVGAKQMMAEVSSDFIGRFGIGLLSGFLVADEIHVYSRRFGVEAEAIHWMGRVDGLCGSELSTERTTAGTRVVLRLRPEMGEQFPAERVLEIARKYARYLPHPITFRGPGGATLVNDSTPPWAGDLSDAERLRIGDEMFEESNLSCFLFRSEEAGADGVAYLKREPRYATEMSSHALYVRGMLISDRQLDLAPPGAALLSVVVNSSRLTPNAGRDAVMANDPRLPALRRDVEAALLGHLDELHRKDPACLETIVITQHRSLLDMVARNRAFLRFLTEYLPMETTLGTMTLGVLFRRFAPVIEYVADRTDFQRLQAKARVEGDCLVLAETEAADRLLSLVASSSRGRKVVRITSRDYLARFSSGDRAPNQREQMILEAVAKELERENCTGAFFEADDDVQMALLDLPVAESIERFLLDPDDVASASKKLKLNRLNPLVSQLIDGAADAGLLRMWIRIAYHTALLEAREIPTAGESRRFVRALGNVLVASTTQAL